MPLKATFFQTIDTPLVDAVDERRLLRGMVVGAGTNKLFNNADLKVTAGGGLNTKVAACVEGGGLLWTPGRFAHRGTYWCYLDEVLTFTHNPADATQARTDLVGIALHDGQYEGDATFSATLGILAGTPGSGAPVPVGDFFQLASVTIPAAAGSITTGMITDKRPISLLDRTSSRIATITMNTSAAIYNGAPASLSGFFTTATDGTMTFTRSCIAAFDHFGVRTSGGSTFQIRHYYPDGNVVYDSDTVRAKMSTVMPMNSGQTFRMGIYNETAGAVLSLQSFVSILGV